MAVLSIRNVDSSALAEWKKSAIDDGISLRQWVIEKLSASTGSKSMLIPHPIPLDDFCEEQRRIIEEAQKRVEDRKKAEP